MIDLIKVFSDKELKYIISVIPTPIIRDYFKRHSKDFQRIFPGFRAKANLPAERFLIEIKRNNDFIINLVSGFLEQSVKEIDEALEEFKKENDCETALIKTLSNSHFSGNPNIYFKLKNEETDEQAVSILLAAIKMYGQLSKENNSLKSEHDNLKKKFDDECKTSKENADIISSIKTELESYKSTNKELNQKIIKRDEDLEQLKYANEILRADLNKANDEIEPLKTELLEAKKQIKVLQEAKKTLISDLESLKLKLNATSDNAEELQTRIEILSKELETKDSEIMELQEKLAAALESNTTKIEDTSNLEFHDVIAGNQNNDLVPTIEVIKGIAKNHNTYYFVADHEEFKTDLDYCLMDANISEGREVLSNYLDRLYSDGKIIVGNRKDCKFVAECFSSILCASEYTKITYFDGIKLRDIITAVENGGRIIYFDNFIGNYNETVLISLLSGFRDKIIIISAMYDKMFMYITPDILRDCNYINLQRLNVPDDVDFEKFTRAEQASIHKKEILDNAPTAALLSILRDLKISEQVRRSLAININNHVDSDAILTFGILPYLVDVRGETPFENSDRLMSYYEKNKNNKFTLKWFIYG
ncbi:MAG: hypothetical protein J1G07_00965 [Clostridiales bacterium]|nr:hypothetical protein [Clostridiales bacterium]